MFVHLADRRSRLVSLALAISVLFCNELCQDEKILFPPLTERTYDVSKVRFSTTLGEEPEVELALV